MLREKVGIYLRITPKGKRFVKPTHHEGRLHYRTPRERQNVVLTASTICGTSMAASGSGKN